MTAAFKALAITLAALAVAVWLAPSTDSMSAVAWKQISAAPRCGDRPPGRCMIDVPYTVQAADLVAVPDDAERQRDAARATARASLGSTAHASSKFEEIR